MEPVAEGAYARAGVDQLLSGNAVTALVEVLSGIRTGRPSRAALASGHYANVLRLDDERGLALSCDSVGSKVIVCEQVPSRPAWRSRAASSRCCRTWCAATPRHAASTSWASASGSWTWTRS